MRAVASVSRLTRLTRLGLGGNTLSPACSGAFLEALEALPALRDLNLCGDCNAHAAVRVERPELRASVTTRVPRAGAASVRL